MKPGAIQFATSLPAHPSNILVFLAVALVFMNSVVWHSSLALALSRPTVQRAYLRHFRTLNKLAGLLVGLMGLKLVVTTIQELLSLGA
ncbi:MAG: LysE family transporter [Polaromonas sp.]|uniref:LysE family transporter n=1 Tax=Polaromonas sp. TaxID=1869339 RepID=UPI001858E413|nr:LysE family transporter [Polaromonas sp.]